MLGDGGALKLVDGRDAARAPCSSCRRHALVERLARKPGDGGVPGLVLWRLDGAPRVTTWSRACFRTATSAPGGTGDARRVRLPARHVPPRRDRARLRDADPGPRRRDGRTDRPVAPTASGSSRSRRRPVRGRCTFSLSSSSLVHLAAFSWKPAGVSVRAAPDRGRASGSGTRATAGCSASARWARPDRVVALAPAAAARTCRVAPSKRIGRRRAALLRARSSAAPLREPPRPGRSGKPAARELAARESLRWESDCAVEPGHGREPAREPRRRRSAADPRSRSRAGPPARGSGRPRRTHAAGRAGARPCASRRRRTSRA